jgi:hypothetical protein
MFQASHQAVPVIVDDVKQHTRFAMTRCTYFSIECDQPSPGWTLSLNRAHIPFYMLGLSGIVLSPPGNNHEFSSAPDIRRLFDDIETNEHLFVDINDLWLPNECFPDSELARGAVYRVGPRLFDLAFQFRHDLLPQHEFEMLAREFSHEVSFSTGETEAFQHWSNEQIMIASEQYHQKTSLALEWGIDERFPEPGRIDD